MYYTHMFVFQIHLSFTSCLIFKLDDIKYLQFQNVQYKLTIK